jgi:hypothetical protein
VIANFYTDMLMNVEKGHSGPFHSDIELNVGCNPKIFEKTIPLQNI